MVEGDARGYAIAGGKKNRRVGRETVGARQHGRRGSESEGSDGKGSEWC